MSPYFDATGLLNDSIPITPSENRSLWLVEYFFMGPADVSEEQAKMALLSCYNAADGKWYPTGDHKTMAEEGFSRDNMLAVTAFGSRVGYKFLAYSGIRNFSYRYLQPQDVIYFLYCCGWIGKLIAFPFMPILLLNMLFSAWNIRRCGSGVLDTDGRILSLVRILGQTKRSWFWRRFGDFFTWISDRRLKPWLKENPSEIPAEFEGKIDGINIWRILFAKYFRDPMHPINVECRRIFP